MDNPCTSWLADAYWDNITELDKLTNFHGLMNSFEQYPRDWHLWYTNASPEKAMLPGARPPPLPFPLHPPPQLPCADAAPESFPWLRFLPLTLGAGLLSPPGEWENACNEMQRMLIVRSLRQDRVSFCVTSFIVSNLGSRFIEPPVLNMKLVSGSAFLPTQPRHPAAASLLVLRPFLCFQVMEDSSPRSPLVFILSPGVDPTSALLQLAEHTGMAQRFHALSLGQGQAPIAARLLRDGVVQG